MLSHVLPNNRLRLLREHPFLRVRLDKSAMLIPTFCPHQSSFQLFFPDAAPFRLEAVRHSDVGRAFFWLLPALLRKPRQV